LASAKTPKEKNDYRSYYQTTGKHPGSCKDRALSIFSELDDAIELINSVGEKIGRFIITLELNGGHGKIQVNNNPSVGGHCDWWVPPSTDPTDYEAQRSGPY